MATLNQPPRDASEHRPPLRAVDEPPHDPLAEQAILGAILRTAQDDNTAAAELLTQAPDPSDYYRPAHETLAAHLTHAAAAGEPLDPIAIHARLHQSGELKPGHLDAAYLYDLVAVAIPTASVPHHAANVRQHAARRRVTSYVARAADQLLDTTTEPIDVLTDVADHIDTALRQEIAGRADDRPRVRNIAEFLAGGDDHEYNWLIPGLLEHRDRVILTGGEGAGKSTLGRQIAVQTAAGLHPFTLERIEPKRVLIVDFENSEDQLRRELRPLNAKAGAQLDPDNLFVETRISGVDLAGSAEDREWFNDIVADARPDIIVTGPTYKMADGDPNEEKSAKPVAMFLDRLREQYGCAIWMEAHVGNEPPGSKKRPTRPFGWSGWRRWPEFGVYLDKSGEIEHWRGQRDSARVWPQILQRGGSWPWGSGTSDNEARWLRIRDCLKDASERLSNRELARRLDMSEAMVRRVTGEFAQQYEALVFQLGGDRDD